MPSYKLDRVVGTFVNRDGVPTILEINQEMMGKVDVADDGLTCDITIDGFDLPNADSSYKFHSGEDYKVLIMPNHMVVDMAKVPPKPELGKAGRVVVSVVALAILTPFIGILWAWASGIVRNLGGLW